MFEYTLATHLGINFAGGNTADSYNSALQQRCSTTPNPDCWGMVASNGDIDMGSSGSSNYADRVHVHDWANPANTGPQRCSPSGGVMCNPPHRRDFDDPLEIDGQVPLVEDMLDACASFPDWRAGQHGSGATPTMLNPWTQAPAALTTISFDGRSWNLFCVGTLLFDRDTILPAAVTPEDPLLVIVRDRMQVDGHVKINCTSCGSGFPTSPNMPRATRLQLFTAAQDQGSGNNLLAAVQIRQQAKIAAAMYAPYASCGNRQSNAQVEIYGSLICRSVLNQGGWAFHYDEALMDGIRSGAFATQSWGEE